MHVCTYMCKHTLTILRIFVRLQQVLSRYINVYTYIRTYVCTVCTVMPAMHPPALSNFHSLTPHLLFFLLLLLLLLLLFPLSLHACTDMLAVVHGRKDSLSALLLDTP